MRKYYMKWKLAIKGLFHSKCVSSCIKKNDDPWDDQD
jgi:hypothetical protein